MSWIITGGCGFVGSNLADALLHDGHEVVVLDNLTRQGSRDNLAWLRSRHGDAWRFVEADIRDADAIERLVRETAPEAIAHLGGQVAMTTSIAHPRRDFEINALGTLNVLEAVRTASPDTIVLYSSTNKVYGSLDTEYQEAATRYVLPEFPSGLDERLQLDGCSPYGCSKLAAEQYCRDYHRTFGLRTVVFRHSSMYGGRQFATFDQGWIGWFCMQAVQAADGIGSEFTISGNGKQVRDVLHADDLIQVYRKAAAHIDATAGQIYNIGGGMPNSLSLLELFDLLSEMTGAELRYRQLPWRLGDQKVFVADYSKATRDFHWQAKVSKQDGLRQMLDWSRQLQPQ